MRRVTILSVLVASITISGCSAADGGEVEGLAQGLTVLDAQVGSLSVAYRQADVVIYMESVRGEATPEPYQRNATSPRFQMDALFTDADGFIFFSQQGGDGWLRPEWRDTLERQVFDHATAGSNEVLYRLATEASATLRADIAAQVGPELAAQLEPEIRAIDDIASRAADVYEEEFRHYAEARDARDLPPVLLDGRGGDVAYGTNGPEDAQWTEGSGYYYIDIHDMEIYEFGRHSATSQYRWLNSAWAYVHQNCNHGDCATQMARKCLHQYYETNAANDYFPSYLSPTCSTGYNAWSDSGGHNCHDDTRVQTRTFINGGISPLNAARNNMWCNGSDDDTDISVNIWGFELDQSGSPDCSASCTRGYNFCP